MTPGGASPDEILYNANQRLKVVQRMWSYESNKLGQTLIPMVLTVSAEDLHTRTTRRSLAIVSPITAAKPQLVMRGFRFHRQENKQLDVAMYGSLIVCCGQGICLWVQ